MLGLGIAIALLLALAFSGHRLYRRRRIERLMRALPGGSPERALVVASFDEINEHLSERRCPCGGRYELLGEGSLARGDARLRSTRLECAICEREATVYFDVTGLFH